MVLYLPNYVHKSKIMKETFYEKYCLGNVDCGNLKMWKFGSLRALDNLIFENFETLKMSCLKVLKLLKS